MPVTQKTVLLNDFGLQQRTRTTSTGKQSVRYSIRIDATPIAAVVDTHEMGRLPAQAIVDHLRKRIETLQVSATDATEVARRNAVKAVARGEDWALQRYTGGRMGTMQPGTVPGNRLFNDSGRLAKGIVANKGDRNEWIVNVPASRLDPRSLIGRSAALATVYARLVEVIPEFGDSAKLFQVASVREAILQAARNVVQRNADLRTRLARARMQAFGAALNLFTSRL